MAGLNRKSLQRGSVRKSNGTLDTIKWNLVIQSRIVHQHVNYFDVRDPDMYSLDAYSRSPPYSRHMTSVEDVSSI